MVNLSGERVQYVGCGLPAEKWRDVANFNCIKQRKHVYFYSMKGRRIWPLWPKSTSENNVFDEGMTNLATVAKTDLRE